MRAARILTTALLPLLAASAAAAAPSLHGYFVDSTALRAEPPRPRDESSGDYACTIERIAPDSVASRLLAVAECSYPPRELLAGLAMDKGYEIGSDTARVPLWWCRGTSERRIPYAATRGALEYYLELTRKYREREYVRPGTQRIFTSGLVYRASIARRDEFAVGARSFTDVYVANVAVSWTYDDGTFEPLVTARRTVVLTPKGAILAVDGDGQGTEDVAISASRGIGRQRNLLR